MREDEWNYINGTTTASSPAHDCTTEEFMEMVNASKRYMEERTLRVEREMERDARIHRDYNNYYQKYYSRGRIGPGAPEEDIELDIGKIKAYPTWPESKKELDPLDIKEDIPDEGEDLLFDPKELVT